MLSSLLGGFVLLLVDQPASQPGHTTSSTTKTELARGPLQVCLLSHASHTLTLGDEIHGILRREGKTAVLVTHDIAEAISMSDRVLVFSSRPARLKATHSIVLSGPDSPIQRRNAPEFKDYFDAIWKELDRQFWPEGNLRQDHRHDQ